MTGDPLALVLLAMEARPLVRSLGAWEPVGVLAEQVRTAAVGGEGMGLGDVQRLRAWTRRWRALPEALCAFYADNTDDPACSAALWHVLQGQPHLAQPHTVAGVHQAYRNRYGHEPIWSLLPRVP